jgi:hypothetical protein
MKGLVFAGCSFTWGQGLYFYSGLNHTPKFDDWVYDYSLMTDALIKFKDTIRFPRLVANHFNTFDVCKATNGGSDVTSLMFLKKIFDKYQETANPLIRSCPWLSEENYYFDDIEYVIFQMTQPYRSGFKFIYKGKDYIVYPTPIFNNVSIIHEMLEDGSEGNVENGIDDIFLKWLDENNYTIQDYLDLHMNHFNNEIKNYLEYLEANGIKTKVLFWMNESSVVFDDDFYKDRHILLEHEGKTYKTIWDLQNSCKERFVIAHDKEGFGGKIPENALSDLHPSKYCHEVIAKNVINSISNEYKIKKVFKLI